MFVLVAFHCVGLILKGNGFRFCSSEGFSASAELRRSPFIDRENRNKGRLCSREKAVLTHCTVSQAFASLAIESRFMDEENDPSRFATEEFKSLLLLLLRLDRELL